MPKANILVVDDEAAARTALAALLEVADYAVETAGDGFKALGRLATFEPDLVLTDFNMPGMDGIELMTKLKEHDAELPVVVMTAFGAVETAVSAMQKGAADYLLKPLNMDELLIVLDRALERTRLRRETLDLRSRLEERYSFENIVGSSQEMQRVFKSIAQIAPSRATVLISGESGTGKELVAAAIHHRSAACFGTVRPPSLCGASRDAARERAFRTRARRLHGSRSQARGTFRAGERWNALSRRNRRDLAGDAGQALAGSARARVRARGRQSDDSHRRARHRRNQSRSQGDGRRRTLPRGSLLPSQRHQPHAPLAQRSGRSTSRLSRCTF